MPLGDKPCLASLGDDVVQQSRYAAALEVPTTLWGGTLDATLALLTAWPLTPRRWLWSFVLATAGAVFSGYLTAISLAVL